MKIFDELVKSPKKLPLPRGERVGVRVASKQLQHVRIPLPLIPSRQGSGN
jgi:hypothetical protein